MALDPSQLATGDISGSMQPQPTDWTNYYKKVLANPTATPESKAEAQQKLGLPTEQLPQESPSVPKVMADISGAETEKPSQPSIVQNPSLFGSMMSSLQSKIKENSKLAQTRQKLFTALYNRPLNESEMKELDPDVQAMLQSGDKSQIEMSIRLLNDKIEGRQNTLDKSIKYLTTDYSDTLKTAATQKKDAEATMLTFVQQYGPQAGDAMRAVYGDAKVQELADMGYDIDQMSSVPLSISQEKTLASLEGGDLGKLLSVTEAKELGLPYGTTVGEAATKGIVPSGGTGDTVLSPSEAASLNVPYGTTKSEAQGMGIVPGAYKATQLTPTQQTKLKLLELGYNGGVSAVDEYNKAAAKMKPAKWGIVSWVSGQGKKLSNQLLDDPTYHDFVFARTNLIQKMSIIQANGTVFGIRFSASQLEKMIPDFTASQSEFKSAKEDLANVLQDTSDALDIYAQPTSMRGTANQSTPESGVTSSGLEYVIEPE